MLLDRHTEVRTLDRLLGDVRGGQSRALVLRGEAGVGKTQLLEYLVDRAAGFWFMRATGVQSEMRALLYNSLGRYGEAREAATRAKDNPPVMGVEPWLVLSELVEAAARSGEPDEAADALRRLAETTQAAGTDWALGVEARCRALVSDDWAAETHYHVAIDRLCRTSIRGELTRARLLNGEWLRRRNRRADSQVQLRTAHDAITAMGMEAFADRTAGELLATGETVRMRSAEAPSQLTAQEAQIARLAREGLSNAEIAARLFISRRTVEWHLSNIFTKLRITSRRQLRT